MFDLVMEQWYPDEESPPIKACCWCDSPLYEGEKVYIINGDTYCKDCLETEFSKIL